MPSNGGQRLHRSGLRAGEAERTLPGDDLLPAATLVIDRATSLDAVPESVWPWLVQIGKDRAGWYFPLAIERWIPRSHRGARRLDPAYQTLEIGDHVRDWGPGSPTLETVIVERPHVLGFRSTRGRTRFTWVLHTAAEAGGSRLQLRLRMEREPDRLTPIIGYAGGLLDWVTVAALFAGLRERLAAR